MLDREEEVDVGQHPDDGERRENAWIEPPRDEAARGQTSQRMTYR